MEEAHGRREQAAEQTMMQLVGRVETQACIVDDVAELGEHLSPADGSVHILRVQECMGRIMKAGCYSYSPPEGVRP